MLHSFPDDSSSRVHIGVAVVVKISGILANPRAIADERAFYDVVRAFAALALPQSDPGFIRSG
jgi:hypothetical protein